MASHHVGRNYADAAPSGARRGSQHPGSRAAPEEQRIQRIANNSSFVDSSRGSFLFDYLYSRAKEEVTHVAALSSLVASLAISAYQLNPNDEEGVPHSPETIFKLITPTIADEVSAWGALTHALALLKERTYLHYRHVQTGAKGGGTTFAHVQQIEFQKVKDKEELLVDQTYKAVTGYDEQLKAASEALTKKVAGSICPALVAPRQAT